MCSLFDSLARRAEVMLPGETVSLTQDAILGMLTACAPCRASKRALKAIATATALPLTEPPLATGRYPVAKVAERLGVSASALRTLIASGTFGPSQLFRAEGRRKYLIPGAIAERMIEHVHYGEALNTFRLTDQELSRPAAAAQPASVDHADADRTVATATATVSATVSAPLAASPTASPAALRPITAPRDVARPPRRTPARSADSRVPRNTTGLPARDVAVPPPLDSWRSVVNPRSTPR
jgi:hypothetical protein